MQCEVIANHAEPSQFTKPQKIYLPILLAQKIVGEILDRRQENNGLIKRLCEEKLSDEIITRIVSDFVIAAGDTVKK